MSGWHKVEQLNCATLDAGSICSTHSVNNIRLKEAV